MYVICTITENIECVGVYLSTADVNVEVVCFNEIVSIISR